MIVHDGKLAAYLGGPYGTTLYLARGAGPMEPVHEFELVEEQQAAAQRRLLLHEDSLFVLEPKDGVLFGDGDLRVRRFDRRGRFEDEVVGRGEEGRAQLAVRSQQDGVGAPWILELYGVDLETGGPLRWRRELPPRWTKRPWSRRSSPAWLGDAVLVPVHNWRALVFEGEKRTEYPVKPGVAQRLKDRLLLVGSNGRVLLDGEVHETGGPPPWPHGREYRGPAALERDDGSLVLLRADGGELPGLLGPGGRLPPGLYDGLVAMGGVSYGIEIAGGPRLVRAEL